MISLIVYSCDIAKLSVRMACIDDECTIHVYECVIQKKRRPAIDKFYLRRCDGRRILAVAIFLLIPPGIRGNDRVTKIELGFLLTKEKKKEMVN